MTTTVPSADVSEAGSYESKAEAKKEAEKLRKQLDNELKAKVIGYIRPIPTVTAVLSTVCPASSRPTSWIRPSNTS